MIHMYPQVHTCASRSIRSTMLWAIAEHMPISMSTCNLLMRYLTVLLRDRQQAICTMICPAPSSSRSAFRVSAIGNTQALTKLGVVNLLLTCMAQGSAHLNISHLRFSHYVCAVCCAVLLEIVAGCVATNFEFRLVDSQRQSLRPVMRGIVCHTSHCSYIHRQLCNRSHRSLSISQRQLYSSNMQPCARAACSNLQRLYDITHSTFTSSQQPKHVPDLRAVTRALRKLPDPLRLADSMQNTKVTGSIHIAEDVSLQELGLQSTVWLPKFLSVACYCDTTLRTVLTCNLSSAQ